MRSRASRTRTSRCSASSAAWRRGSPGCSSREASLWLAGRSVTADAGTQAVVALLLHIGSWSPAAWLFSLGSACFCWLLWRGRMVPAPLAILGVIASIVLVFVLPLELAGFIRPSFWAVWMPMLVFELTFAGWLLVKGVARPALARGTT